MSLKGANPFYLPTTLVSCCKDNKNSLYYMKNSNKRFFVNVFLQIVACLYTESPYGKGFEVGDGWHFMCRLSDFIFCHLTGEFYLAS